MSPDNPTCVNKVKHGRMNCNRCWPDASVEIQESGAFRLVRDPGHWGSTNPANLVLGISKGNTQSSAFATDPFDAVAFKGIRHRLLQVLQVVGLLSGETPTAFERRFCASEQEFAFASVLRCSMTGMDRKKGIHTADSPNVAPAFKTGSPGYRFAAACVDQHLGKLPSATKRVLLLGTTDAYVDNLRDLIARTRGGFEAINAMAFRAGGVLFVNVCHPSKGNGYFGAYLRGEGQSGQKKRMAEAALASTQ